MDTVPVRAPRRKALVIGINYVGNLSWGEVSGQQDAEKVVEFLVDDRGWKREDIVLMKDSLDFPEERKPTRVNMYRELRNFVDDARVGDRFVLYYAGHSDQLDSNNPDEEDGMDEVLIPADCEQLANESDFKDCVILDDDLKALVVDRLPRGSRLTAIFDTCHSGTMLDLEHYHCNTVYVPWLSKGRRRSDTIRAAIRRADAMLFAPLVGSYKLRLTGSGTSEVMREVSNDTMRAAIRRDVILFAPLIASYKLRLTGSATSKVIWELSKKLPSPLNTFRSSLRTPTLSASDPPELYPDERQERWMLSPHRRSRSPEHLPTRPCDGFCSPSITTKKAHVVSLSACSDAEQTWGSDNGGMMTSELLDTLRKNPNCSYKELLTALSHRLHKMASERHSWVRDAKRKHKQKHHLDKSECSCDENTCDDVVNIEMHNFQYPQLGSHVPLNMDDPFVL